MGRPISRGERHEPTDFPRGNLVWGNLVPEGNRVQGRMRSCQGRARRMHLQLKRVRSRSPVSFARKLFYAYNSSP